MSARRVTGKLKCDMRRCGRGCTKAEYDRAMAGARALKRRLGRGWQSTVWENLGWFFKVERGRMSVMRSRPPRRYTAIFMEYYVATATRPEDAIRYALRMARAAAKEIEDAIEQSS